MLHESAMQRAFWDECGASAEHEVGFGGLCVVKSTAEKSFIGCDAFPALSTLLLLLSGVMLEWITVAESEAEFCVVRSLALRVFADRGACSSETWSRAVCLCLHLLFAALYS